MGWREIPWISIGAVLGACARYALSRAFLRVLSPAFPYGTLAVNISGSVLLGFFLIWTAERALVDPRWRLFLAVGFCGSYTTFSSYAYETFAYFEQGHWLLLATNILANNVVCLVAVMAGAALARWL